VAALDDMSASLLPDISSMRSDSFTSVILPLLKTLYELPNEEWLDTANLISAFGEGTGARHAGMSLLDVFVIQITAQLLQILSDFGAADVDWGNTPGQADQTPGILLSDDNSTAQPGYQMRLTPLGQYGIRNVLLSKGHTARIVGDLATAAAATLLDALRDYQPAAFTSEITGWLANRDQPTAVTQLLEAIPGPDPHLAVRVWMIYSAGPAASRIRATIRSASSSLIGMKSYMVSPRSAE
jgi:hypothetical protein